jgi:hypothetical protein
MAGDEEQRRLGVLCVFHLVRPAVMPRYTEQCGPRALGGGDVQRLGAVAGRKEEIRLMRNWTGRAGEKDNT